VGKASRNMVKIVRDKVSHYGLTPTQFFLLIALYEENGILITALAKKVALDKSTLTSLLDRLERDDLIQRTAHPTDRRIIQIYLTPKAEAMRDDLLRIYSEVNGLFLSRLTSEELKNFEEILGKFERVEMDGKDEV
jgi:DNA-binding MarR family transcriptional regulator